MAGDRYSLVMRDFTGKHSEFSAAAERAFGRRGIAAFSLCRMRRDHLPAEIAADLSREDAKRVQTTLASAGASIDVVPSEDVAEVRHRAHQCWPSRLAGYWRFTELDGMILTLDPINARENAARALSRSPGIRPWQLERSMNHQHPSTDRSRRGLRIARAFGQELAAALKVAYPERGFVISYLEEQVSFYQRGDGAPETQVPPHDEPRAKAFCETCRHGRPYRTRGGVDPEFPEAEWGTCLECGIEVLVRASEKLVCI